MSNEKAVAERISKIREALHLKQRDFARELGVSAPSYSEVENGKYKPNFDFIESICRKYNVNPHFLLYGEGDMFTQAGDTGREHFKYAVKEEIIRDFFWYFHRSKIVQLYVVGYFQGIYQKNKALIQKEIDELTVRKK